MSTELRAILDAGFWMLDRKREERRAKGEEQRAKSEGRRVKSSLAGVEPDHLADRITQLGS
jgi:hypothetical protein